MIYDCIIVGGGAAGLSAAVMLGRQQKQVLLIEQCKELGKKLYATGNGRCNFSNTYFDENVYRGDSEFANEVYQKADTNHMIAFMHSLGILEQEKDGYLYPYTNQAKTVVEGLIRALDEQYITQCLDRIVKKIHKKENELFEVETSYGVFEGKTVLLCCGGVASTFMKKEPYHGYKLAEFFGHTVTDVYPALCAMYSKDAKVYGWKGVRANASVQLFLDQGCKQSISPVVSGELQLTDKGISGIPTFQVSRYGASYIDQGTPIYAKLDFYPEKSVKELALIWINSMKCNQTIAKQSLKDALTGMMHPVLVDDFCNNYWKHSQLVDYVNRKVFELDEEQMKALFATIKEFVLKIDGIAGFENAQVTAGGVETNMIDVDTMESNLESGVFFAGEMLNVDGTCGGYNIQFAYSSAVVACDGIVKRLEQI